MTEHLNTLRVLLVDDEPDIRLLQRRLLAKHGIDVVGEAADGADAVVAAQRLQPDVVVLDLAMPKRGDEALPHLLAVAPRSMVVICSSATNDEVDVDRLLNAGAFAYVHKRYLVDLPTLVTDAYARFRSALDGEEVVAPWVERVQPQP